MIRARYAQRVQAIRAWWRRQRLGRYWLHAVECSWCQLYRPGKPANVTGWSTVEHSHGICPECRILALVEAAPRAHS